MEKEGWSGVEKGEERCARCSAALDHAAEAYAVLAAEGGGFRRRDLCGACFRALPERPSSFWRRQPGRRANKGAPKKERRAARARDLDALFELFGRLAEEEAQSGAGATPRAAEGLPRDVLTPDERAKLRYILALALVRRRRLELVDLAREGGADCLVIRASGRAELLTVEAPRVSEEDLSRLAKEIEAEMGLA
jgi:hypothetical protein